MKIDLSGRTAVVTGSSAGIGKAIAEGLVAAGASVVVNGRNPESVARSVADLEDSGDGVGRVTGVVADVATAKGCERLFSAAPRADVLVNNVATYSPKPLFSISDAEWLQYFEANVLSGIRLSRLYVPQMCDRRWGRVIFISSESGVEIPTEMVHYGVTKTAQLALSRGLAESLTTAEVTVNAVLPGPTLTEGAAAFMRSKWDDPEMSLTEVGREIVEAQRPNSLLKRMASPAEVANLVVYLASPLSSATTGSVLRVDGGIIRSVL